MNRILLVDDEQSISNVVQAYLERAGYEVSVAEDGMDAINKFQRRSPDLIILDLMLPKLSGEEVCRFVRERSTIPIVMLTAKTSEEERITGLEMGADDYLIKPFSPRELVARVKAIFRRISSDRSQPDSAQPIAQEQVISFRNDQLIIYPERHEVKVKGTNVELTPTEFKLLLAMSKSPDRVFSRDQLASIALGYDYAGYDDTIYTHIKNLRHKIDSHFKEMPFIATVYGVGYKFVGDESHE